jgi:hypothetical protein
VKHRFQVPADPDLKYIGYALDDLARLRSLADYNLSPLPDFQTDTAARDASQRAADSIDLLDAIEADPARLAAAVAAIRAAFP